MADKSHDSQMQNRLYGLPVPRTLYACSAAGCRQEQTRPAENLCWFSGNESSTDDKGLTCEAVEAGWYCPQCRERLKIGCDGPLLSEVLSVRAGRGEPMPDDGALIHALNMAGDEPAPHAAALHEVARTMLRNMAGSELLPAYDPDKPLEGEAAELPATEIARREMESPTTLHAITVSPALATRIALELLDMSVILQAAAQASKGNRKRIH